MNQSERDELSIFMMSQDGRITELAERANYFESQVWEVKSILRDSDLTPTAKIRELKSYLGMSAKAKRNVA